MIPSQHNYVGDHHVAAFTYVFKPLLYSVWLNVARAATYLGKNSVAQRKPIVGYLDFMALDGVYY